MRNRELAVLWTCGLLVFGLGPGASQPLAQEVAQPPAAPPPSPPPFVAPPPIKDATGTPAGFFFEPSLLVSEAYDDNLFLDPEQAEADYFTRITPGLQTGYRSGRVQVTGSAQFDAERYNRHSELDTMQARRNVGLDLSGMVTPRLTLLANATYTHTTTPGELNLLSGLVVGRNPADRFAVRPSLVYRTSPRGRLMAGYMASYDRLEGFTDALTQESTVEYRHAVTSRTFLSTDYTFRMFDFDSPLPTHPSHVAAVGVGHAFTPNTTLLVRGGPRFSAASVQPPVAAPLAPLPVVDERSIDPEWSVALQHRGRRGEAELNFARSQTTAIGQSLVIDTMSAGATLTYRPGSRVELRASPTVYRDTGGPLEARVLRLAADFTVWLSNHIAIVSQYSGGFQDGTRVDDALPGPMPTLRQNIVSIGLRASARRRVPPREPVTAAPVSRGQ